MEPWIRVATIAVTMFIANMLLAIILMRYPHFRFQRALSSFVGAAVGVVIGVTVVIGTVQPGMRSGLIVIWIAALSSVTYLVLTPAAKRIIAFGEAFQNDR